MVDVRKLAVEDIDIIIRSLNDNPGIAIAECPLFKDMTT